MLELVAVLELVASNLDARAGGGARAGGVELVASWWRCSSWWLFKPVVKRFFVKFADRIFKFYSGDRGF